LGCHDAVAQCGQGGIGLLGHLGPQESEMVCEGVLPPARAGLRRTAAALAPLLPEFLDKRATDTKALGNGSLGLCPGCELLDDPVT
jgi:hypothetical protein